MHTDELLHQLRYTANGDLREQVVYSSHRPMDGSWVRDIEGVTFLTPQPEQAGVLTYVVVPQRLSAKQVRDYELTLVSDARQLSPNGARVDAWLRQEVERGHLPGQAHDHYENNVYLLGLIRGAELALGRALSLSDRILLGDLCRALSGYTPDE